MELKISAAQEDFFIGTKLDCTSIFSWRTAEVTFIGYQAEHSTLSKS
jgi:hypothetical protein